MTATERRLYAAIFVGLSLVSLVPVWAFRYLPLTDYGQHMSAVAVWHEYGSPRFDFARYYTLSLGLTPYWGCYLAWRAFAFVTSIETAGKLLLSLYVVGLPLGMLLLGRRFGRSPWLALFSFPLVWNMSFGMGFLPFLFGLLLLPYGLAVFDRFCERPTLGWGIAAALVGIAIYFSHLLAWGFYVASAGLIGLLHDGRTLRRLGGRFAVWLPSVAVGLLCIRFGSGYHMGAATHPVGRFYPIHDHLRDLALGKWIWHGCQGAEGKVLALGLGLLWLAVKLGERWDGWCPSRWRAEACFVTGFCAYLLLPRSLLAPTYWWGINVRYASVAALFLGLCVHGPLGGRRRLLLIAPLVGLAIGFVVDMALHFQRAARYAAGYDDVASLPPPGARVLMLTFGSFHDPSWDFNYAQTFWGIRQAQHGGYMPWNFDDGFPLRYRVRYPAASVGPQNFCWDKHARYYDYVMLMRPPPDLPFFKGHEREVKKIGASGQWQLWKLPGPREDTPPRPPYPPGWAYDSRCG